MKRRAVVTGMGIVTAIGCDVASFRKNMFQGICGIGPISLFDASGYRSRNAAEVRNFSPDLSLPLRDRRRLSRCDQMGLKAAAEAVLDAGLEIAGEDPERIGVFIGGGAGGILSAEKYRRDMIRKGPRQARPSLLIPFATSALTDALAEVYGIRGTRMTVATACSSSATAIGLALASIRAGETDLAVVGGSESLSEVTFGGFNALRSVDEECCRPFDLHRRGLSLGEGAAVLILEEAGRALRRKAGIHAEVCGFGLTADGHHMTAPDPQGGGARRAMEGAVRDGGMQLSEIDYINAHGTATPANDLAETNAIKKLFGEKAREIPVSSIKAMVGHCLGAAGAVEAVATVLSVSGGRIPATIHYETPDPECDLDYVPDHSREKEIRFALSNSFAFGGNNTALVFGRWKI
jgi:3-oxoacyl-[acyl-carrier-protein] synthase II